MKHQRGFGLFGWIFVLGFAGLLLIASFRIVPLYIDYLTVVDIVEKMYAQGRIEKQSKRQIQQDLVKRFRQNNLWDLNSKEVVKLVKDKRQGMLMHISYQATTPLFYNLEVVATFDKKIGNSS